MKQMRAWLRMVAETGDYPAPTSEATYLAHLDLIDVALPTHGGWLESDGSWTTFPSWENNDFSQSLPAVAAAAGHPYVPVLNPGHGGVGTNLIAVLDNPSCWQDSADEVVATALTDRWDSPWDGVVYDAIGFTRDTDPAYYELHQDYLAVMSQTVRAAGLPFGMGGRGQLYTYWTGEFDFGVLNQICDSFEYYFLWYRQEPSSSSPYFWINKYLAEALAAGFDAGKLYLGVGNYGAYYPVTGETTRYLCTHTQALELVDSYSSSVEWVESDPRGLIREKYATLGAGHLWLLDGDTISTRLSLADRYKLPGMMLFIAGMGDDSTWQAIEDWKRVRIPQRRRRSRRARRTDWRAFVT